MNSSVKFRTFIQKYSNNEARRREVSGFKPRNQYCITLLTMRYTVQRVWSRSPVVISLFICPASKRFRRPAGRRARSGHPDAAIFAKWSRQSRALAFPPECERNVYSSRHLPRAPRNTPGAARAASRRPPSATKLRARCRCARLGTTAIPGSRLENLSSAPPSTILQYLLYTRRPGCTCSVHYTGARTALLTYYYSPLPFKLR